MLKKKPLLWRIFLLTASYFFYATWNFRFLFLIFAISLFNFYVAKKIQSKDSEKKRKILISGAVAVNIFVLALFKYFDFFRVSAELLLSKLGSQSNILLLNIILPIGLSFYILRAISYLVDVFRRKIKAEESLLDFSIYIAFFPQLLSGPIMRASEFLPQLKDGGVKKLENMHEYFALILGGLFKKIVIASFLTTSIVNDVLAVPQNHSQLSVVLALYAYAIVIYCDFSGYSDIAVGISGLMGFKSPRNFNSPYSSLNFSDFWKRWHITFSSWLKDYVYIPLGGNRKGKLRKYINLSITMLVSGLWHGTGLNFIFWGISHGIGLIYGHMKLRGLTVYSEVHCELPAVSPRPELGVKASPLSAERQTFQPRSTVAERNPPKQKIGIQPRPYDSGFLRRRIKEGAGEEIIKKGRKFRFLNNFLSWFSTLNSICLLWLFFAVGSLEDVLAVLRQLFNWRAGSEPIGIYTILVIIFSFLIFGFEDNIRKLFVLVQNKIPFAFQILSISVFIIILMKLGPDIIPPFIYFKF